MRDLGVTVVRHVWDRVGLEAPAWHDLSEIDAVLCVATDALGGGLLHKPPTKLINAWNGGAIPIVATDQPGYVDLAVDGVDSVFVKDAFDVASAIRLLQTQTDLLPVIETNICRRAQEFSTASILGRWEELLSQTGPAPDTFRSIRTVRAHAMAATTRPRAAARFRLRRILRRA